MFEPRTLSLITLSLIILSHSLASFMLLMSIGTSSKGFYYLVAF